MSIKQFRQTERGMIEDYKIITITHKSAALKDIGQFVLQETNTHSVLKQLQTFKEEMSVEELFYLPTCNRVLYFFCSKEKLDRSFLHRFNEVLYPNWDAFRDDVFQCFEGEQALEHLFEVSASVDSLVVGEREIIRQIKQAYEKCHAQKLTGDAIRLAMDTTVRTAKRVYAQTRIGEKPVSIVSLAVKKMLEADVAPEDRLLLVGAGQTNRLVAKFLKKYGFNHVTVFNRTLSKAKEVAETLQGANAYTLAELKDYDKGFDCIVVCTGAIEPVITHEVYKRLLQGETETKVLIDLAIPNNVAADVRADFNMNYIEIDGLKALANKNMNFRRQEVARAIDIIQEEVDAFNHLYRERQLEVALRDMPVQIKEVTERAMNAVFAKEVEELDEETKALFVRMMSYMEKKCIGIPMQVAKKAVLPQFQNK